MIFQNREIIKHRQVERHADLPFEEYLFANGFYVSFAPNCPEEVKTTIFQQTGLSGSEWFKRNLKRVNSRRRMSFENVPKADGESVTYVIKEKSLKPKDPKQPDLDIPRYTTSAFHEMRTSFLLADILEKNKEQITSQIPFQDQMLTVQYEVQLPWAAIINTKPGLQKQEKYSVFQYLPGTSVRNELASEGGWNNASEEQRKLFGQIDKNISNLSRVLVDNGLEPYDLGAHQVVYTINLERNCITLGILDTEEFRPFSGEKESPRLWNDSWYKHGLPSVLIISSIWGMDAFDD